MMVEEEHVLDAGFAQHGFDFAGGIGCFVFGAEQRPDDAVVGLVLVLGPRPTRYSSMRRS
jgi:hypothetical protein